ncbi:MAG: GNAT family N-acetyltransferase [Aggregatilineales bacterium]
MTDFLISAATFELRGTVTVRKVRESDLKLLEWQGQFRHFRNLFLRSYQGQLKGNRYMLVADYNRYPIARLFIRFSSRNALIADGHQRAYLYSFYVLEMFRGQGLGTYLIQSAETLLKARGFGEISIAVAKDNPGALRLYQRQGYEVFKEDEGRWQYVDHRGRMRQVHEPCWLLEKHL